MNKHKHEPFDRHALYSRCVSCGATMASYVRDRKVVWRVDGSRRTRILAGPIWDYQYPALGKVDCE